MKKVWLFIIGLGIGLVAMHKLSLAQERIELGRVGVIASANVVTKEGIETKRGPIVLTDLAGRNVTFKGLPVERVVLQYSGSGGAFYTLFALEGKEGYKKIVGIDPGLKKSRYDIWNMYVDVIPELAKIPDIGNISDGSFGIEKVITLKSDVVIFPMFAKKPAEDSGVIEKLEEAGIPIVFIDYHAETRENHVKSITLIGKILGKEERAKELIEFYDAQIEKFLPRLEKINKPKPKVYVELGMKGPSEYSNTYGKVMWGAMIVKCGGINIAEGKVEKWGPINPEYLFEANPDIIMIAGSYWPEEPKSFRLGYGVTLKEAKKSLMPFTKRPGWDSLSAVQNRRVYGIYHGISRDIWDFAPQQYMVKCFYPEEFKDIDPQKNLKEFYKRFLPVPYAGVWMMSLW